MARAEFPKLGSITVLFQKLDHALAQSVADQEIGFRVAEFVMAVPGIRRIFGAADKVVRFDENDIAFELGPIRGVGLGFPQRGPPAGSVHPGPSIRR